MARTPELLAVAGGGCVGTLVRAGAEHAWPAAHGALPVTTLTVNLLGALLLGLLLGHLVLSGPDTGRRKTVRLALGTGFMGGLTTYSTLVLETQRLLSGGHAVLGTAYLLGSLLAGLVLAGAGLRLAQYLHTGGRR